MPGPPPLPSPTQTQPMRRELTGLFRLPRWSGPEAQHCLGLEAASPVANRGPAPPLRLLASLAFNTSMREVRKIL